MDSKVNPLFSTNNIRCHTIIIAIAIDQAKCFTLLSCPDQSRKSIIIDLQALTTTIG
jgi:hypothetical protein